MHGGDLFCSCVRAYVATQCLFIHQCFIVLCSSDSTKARARVHVLLLSLIRTHLPLFQTQCSHEEAWYVRTYVQSLYSAFKDALACLFMPNCSASESVHYWCHRKSPFAHCKHQGGRRGRRGSA